MNMKPEVKDFLDRFPGAVVQSFQASYFLNHPTTALLNFMDDVTGYLQKIEVDYVPYLKIIEEVFQYLSIVTERKISKLTKDKNKAFERQIKLLEEIREKAFARNDLKTSLEAIKETNKLTNLYEQGYFETDKVDKNRLNSIREKVMLELESELGELL
jgi:uncharacterized protein (DUF1499 family)